MIRTFVLDFPCLDAANRYSGCVGLDACPAVRCWNGRRLHAAGASAIEADSFDIPVRVERYTACKCPTCINAVDVVGRIPAQGREVEHWTTCREGLWSGPVSIYNLVNRRIPLKNVGPCPLYEPAPELRPEVARKRQEDRERTRRWKLARKQEKLKKAS